MERAKGGSLRVLALVSVLALGIGFAYWRHLYSGGHCQGEDPTVPLLKAVAPALAILLVGGWIALGARDPGWRWIGLVLTVGASLVALQLGMPKEFGCMLVPG